MQLILTNHAERERDPDRAEDIRKDPIQPLSANGERQARALADAFGKQGIRPTLYLTSRNVHARQTAEILLKALGGEPIPELKEIDALTPRSSTESFADVIAQAKASGCDPGSHGTVAIIGHWPRLGHLFAELTSTAARTQRLEKAQAVVVTGESLDSLARGEGAGEWPRTDAIG